MALQIKFTVSKTTNCKGFDFTELTGIYASNNLGGYGTPNPDYADATSTSLAIKNTTSGITYDPITTIIASPSDTTSFTSADLKVGGGSIGDIQLPDGLYSFTYSVVINSVTYKYTFYIIFMCGIDCAFQKLTSKLKADLDCVCNRELLPGYLEIYTLWIALHNSGSCNNLTEINNILKLIKDMIATQNCESC